ncbi:hypothetical protein [Aquirufa salirivi]
MKNKLNESRVNNLDHLNLTDNQKIWISPQLVSWLTDQIENAAGKFVDGGAKTYLDF